MDNKEPTITIPISFFREIALGYRYSTYSGNEADNLRHKCVLRKELVDIIKATPGYEKFFHIQETGKDSLPLVWHIREWKDLGEADTALRAKCDKERNMADKLFELMRVKLKGLDATTVKALALEYIRTGADLTPFGIKKEDYE